VPLNDLPQRLGHGHEAFTLKVCRHLLPSSEQEQKTKPAAVSGRKKAPSAEAGEDKELKKEPPM
jgi:hypothetical protein